ncbi:hypothetical protein EIN_019450 [Entamoeba invadens IP1]|uniref:hypothetical protein n=1 Tax=Entamoeba invadens IP1 TaxID=370355 RepID=UPI0002C3EF84|nr:hypothetical protein EIN_019450 [Entamoeba invadens IP1]ELP90546.1 hypothetical protein EIN_019450 [Entamoeba invadens IP1]|eukprot:XP_004257317.1 hypothetical protein EIN_019450 [Entamoeba invadens IP1]
MEYHLVGSKIVDTTSYDQWIKLAQSNEDFQILADKETLQKIVHSFQLQLNKQCREYFVQQYMVRMVAVEKEFNRKYNVLNEQLIQAQNELEAAKEEQNTLKRTVYALQQKKLLLEQKLAEVNATYQSVAEMNGQATLEQLSNIHFLEKKYAELEQEVAQKKHYYDEIYHQYVYFQNELGQIKAKIQKYTALLSQSR